MHNVMTDQPTLAVPTQPTQVFTGQPVEDTLGGLSLIPTLTGDPAVMAWLAAVSTTGRAW